MTRYYHKKDKKVIRYKGATLKYTGGRRNQCRSYRCEDKIIWIPESQLDGYRLKKDACIDNILTQEEIIFSERAVMHDISDTPIKKVKPTAYYSFQPVIPMDEEDYDIDDIIADIPGEIHHAAARHHQLNSPSVSDTTKDNIVLPKNPNEYVYIPAKKPYSIIMKVSFLRRVGFLK